MLVNSIRCDSPDCDTEHPSESAMARHMIEIKPAPYPGCPSLRPALVHVCDLECLHVWTQSELAKRPEKFGPS